MYTSTEELHNQSTENSPTNTEDYLNLTGFQRQNFATYMSGIKISGTENKHG